MTVRRHETPHFSNDPTDYGLWRCGLWYEGVAFVATHERALNVAAQCRQLGARCYVEPLARRYVLLMPESAPEEAVELAERMAG